MPPSPPPSTTPVIISSATPTPVDVNNVFWKLHGWIDTRIEDWKAANSVTGEPHWVGTWMAVLVRSEGNSYQHTSFDQFIEAVELQMQPEGRALHTAGMHQHLRTLLPHDMR